LDWQIQRDYYWQLSWRAPEIIPQTAILSDGVSSNFISNFSVGFGLNTLYARLPVTDQLAYWFFTPKPGDPSFITFEQGAPITYRFRNLEFSGSTSKSLVVSYAPAVGCVRVLTPETALDPVLRDVAWLVDLSNLTRIVTAQPILPDAQIFGTEPPQDWCYYFEKADLALQNENWGAVIRLMDEAAQKGFSPQTGGELLPLMDAYARTGAWEKAYQTSLKAQSLTIDMEPMLCAAWQRYANFSGGDDQKTSVVAKSLDTFKCPSD
jgi:hypothetical protein